MKLVGDHDDGHKHPPTVDSPTVDAPRRENDEDHVEIPGSIGVALSGGGVRAALFSLGVLMYLVRSGLNARVTTITSVSGGSITNAAIAASGDFSKMTVHDFGPLCGKLAHRLAKQGSFFLPRMRLLFKVLLLVGTILSSELFSLEWMAGHRSAVFLTRSIVLLLAELVVIFFLALTVDTLFRKPFQRGVYQRLINICRPDKKPRLRTHALPLSELAKSDVTHVICATELLSGQPMFFSRKWIYSETFGWGRPKLSTDRAVYASAAYPGGFTPLRLKTKGLEMGGGDSNRDRPSDLLLTDGGVFNNLGTDWFHIAEGLSRTPLRHDHRFSPPPPTDYNIVVNASSPSREIRLSNIPVVHLCLMFARTMTILYENTVRPRIKELGLDTNATTLLDISKSPVALAKLARDEALPGQAARAARADHLIGQLDTLQGLSGHYWDELVDNTSLLKTTLQSVGTERAARLMRHGYLSAMVALHIRFDLPCLETVPDDRTFIELTENKRPKRRDADPDAPAADPPVGGSAKRRRRSDRSQPLDRSSGHVAVRVLPDHVVDCLDDGAKAQQQ